MAQPALSVVASDAEQGGGKAPEPELVARLDRWSKAVNIADDADITGEQLSEIGQTVTREYEIDSQSLSDWREKTERAEKIANQLAENKSYPWPKASNVLYPLITTSALQFAARAYPAIVAGRNVVRGSVVGNDDGVPAIDPQTGQPQMGADGKPVWKVQPGEKQARAYKIGAHMSFQLLDEQTEWEPETDKLLHVLPIVGTAFRKIYFDPERGRNASIYVSALDLFVNYNARSLERAPRITEEILFYPQEIEEKVRAGLFREITYTSNPESHGDDDAPITFLEQHRWLDLDEDGLKEPYIVTVCKASSEVVRIIARYEMDGIKYNHTKGKIQKIEPVHYYEAYQFLPNFEMKGSIYGTGFGRLLLPLNESINTTLNMLLDAGHLANTQGGFVGKGLSMNSGSMRFQPGEWKMLNATGASIKDNIVPLKFDGPSPVLFQLLQLLIEAGKEVAAVKDVLSGDNQNVNTPATTTLAIIEQGLKVFSSIYKRIHRSLKGELQKMYRLNRIYLEEETSYRDGSDWKTIMRSDYKKGSGVEPFSDPTMVTDQQRLGRAQFLMQFVGDPTMNGMEIKTRMLDAAGIDNIQKLFNPNPPPNPAVVAKAAELEAKHREIDAASKLKEAQGILARAQAINQFAQADKAVGDTHMGWIQQQLEVIRVQLEAAQAGQDGGAGADGPPAAVPQAGHPIGHVVIPPALVGAPQDAPGSPEGYLAAARHDGNLG